MNDNNGAKDNGQRLRFRAIVKNITKEKGYKDKLVKRVMLQDVKYAHNESLFIECVKMPFTKAMENAKWKVGDYVQFEARAGDRGGQAFLHHPSRAIIIKKGVIQEIQEARKRERELFLLRLKDPKWLNDYYLGLMEQSFKKDLKKIYNEMREILREQYEKKYKDKDILWLVDLMTIDAMLIEMDKLSRKDRGKFCQKTDISERELELAIEIVKTNIPQEI